MTETTGAGASSRADRVLAPAFVDRLHEQSLEEIRLRRDEALAEREFQSYLRRLVQVRQDILRAEEARRAAGEQPVPIMERLASVLSGGPRGSGRGEALRLNLSPADVAEAERRADEGLGGFPLATPEEVDDARLHEVLHLLDELERTVSDVRGAVIKVHDQLQEELKRRYREDPSLIAQGH
jgi:hypothetical protein